SGYDHGNYQSYLFFALDLKKNHYTRTQLADITREINLLFDMPAMLLIRHNGALTFSIIDRRLHNKDQSRDVLEKVELIKDIRYQDPHRAHIEILHDLSLQALMAKHECRDFKQLHEAWRTTLDTNELNKKFYRELADWYFWALDHVEYPADVEKDEATRNATNVIRLLTRLIFCWFLKEKGLILADLFSERKLAGVLKSLKDDDSTFYRAILQNLFFGTLNQGMNTGGRENRKFSDDRVFQGKRKDYGIKNLYRYKELFAATEAEAVELFASIPFLNGGLFDCLDKEDDSGKVIYVDGFTRNRRKQPKVPNFLFFSDYRTLDLSDAYGDKKRKKEKVRGLINLLDSYKFTVTENTPIEEEIALDPELLGKVFENLLASYNPETGTTARKQTGSFYTPREIVNYMVDESLIAYLEGQLKAKVPKLAEMKDLQDLLREVFAYTERVHPFDEEEVEALIDAIDNCKILDPACGSGAFPMGILHKLVFILRKLDPKNERWKQKQLDKLDSVAIREELERIFEDNDDDYGRKLYLIENCIYGVDIQPIAIQISKLRFFISLICNQRTNKNKAQNCGVRPLPNLETKFVAANTLISLKKKQTLLRNPEIDNKETRIEGVRKRYFSVRSRREKLKLQEQDRQLRMDIYQLLKADGWDDSSAKSVAEWNPYEADKPANYFDPEWMYGVHNGFDVAIGNPPYVRQEKIRHLKPLLKDEYVSFTGTADLYVYFYERAIEMLTEGGVLSFISSNKFFRSGYGKSLRAYLTRNMRLRHVIDFGDAPVFTAIAYPTILVARKKTAQDSGADSTFYAMTWQPGPEIADFVDIYVRERFAIRQDKLSPVGWRLESAQVLALLDKLTKAGTPFGDYVKGMFYYGIKTGLNEAFVVDRATRDRLIAEDPRSEEILKPFLRGRDVKRWRVDFADQYLIKIESSENKKHPWSGKDNAEEVFASIYPAIHK
ncbi:MAG: Eco57I restriction-modification methylase domain-containing protein, partial [Chloroflexota bacterium]|nr:Eco57I restriction-modification methylase domain-containing protein [Chloroflexota bacterium]